MTSPLTESLDETFTIGHHRLSSRLIVGTGKYASFAQMQDALAASGTSCITVAIRRERLYDAAGENILDHIDLSKYLLLPNTAGCYTAKDALRTARLGREILTSLENPGADWVKLEVLGDQRTLLPDPVATLDATRELVADGFQVLCYTSDDPVMARRLKDAARDGSNARRKSDRFGAGDLEPKQHPHHSGILESQRLGIPGHHRRRRRHSQRRHARHGIGSRWCFAQHRDRARGSTGRHGGCHASRDHGRANGLSGGSNSQATVCHGQQSRAWDHCERTPAAVLNASGPVTHDR